MGQDIHVHVAKYNEKTNLYDELVLYKPGEEYHYDSELNKIIDNPDFQRVHIYNKRDDEMFDGMKDGDENDGYGHFPWIPIRFNSLEPSFRDRIKSKTSIVGCYDFYEINLADMKNYLHDHPIVVDYDSELWEDYEKDKRFKPRKDNPIEGLYKEICNYIFFADNDWDWIPLSSYKVIFYFDC